MQNMCLPTIIGEQAKLIVGHKIQQLFGATPVPDVSAAVWCTWRQRNIELFCAEIERARSNPGHKDHSK